MSFATATNNTDHTSQTKMGDKNKFITISCRCRGTRRPDRCRRGGWWGRRRPACTCWRRTSCRPGRWRSGCSSRGSRGRSRPARTTPPAWRRGGGQPPPSWCSPLLLRWKPASGWFWWNRKWWLCCLQRRRGWRGGVLIRWRGAVRSGNHQIDVGRSAWLHPRISLHRATSSQRWLGPLSSVVDCINPSRTCVIAGLQ